MHEIDHLLEATCIKPIKLSILNNTAFFDQNSEQYKLTVGAFREAFQDRNLFLHSQTPARWQTKV